MTATRPKDKKIRRAERRSLEQALREERAAISAIVKVMLIECPDPTRALARIDAMARAAQGNSRYSPGTRQALLDAARFVRRAVEREQGRQESLLDPPRPEPSDRIVKSLVAATDGPQQLGFVNNTSVLGDVEAAHIERVATISAVHAELVRLLLQGGAATDRELHARYETRRQDDELPRQSFASLQERRRELTAAGRIVRVPGRPTVAEPTWDVVERDALQPNQEDR